MFCDSGIDWAATGSMIGGLALMLTAITAFRTANAWKSQQRFGVQAEQALSILVLFHEALLSIERIRTSAILKEEHDIATEELGEKPANATDAEWRQRVTSRVIINRIQSRSRLWESIQAKRTTAKALFAPPVEQALEDLLSASNELRLTANFYATAKGDDVIDKLRAKLFSDELYLDENGEEVHREFEIDKNLKEAEQKLSAELRKYVSG